MNIKSNIRHWLVNHGFIKKPLIHHNCWLDDVHPSRRVEALSYGMKKMLYKSLKEAKNGEVVEYKFGTDDYKKTLNNYENLNRRTEE